MSQEVEEGLIYSKTGFRLYRSVWGDRIELEGVYKPLEHKGWGGNFEKYVITVGYDNDVKIKRVRDNWNGSGMDIVAHCKANKSEAKKIRQQIIQAKDEKDFEKLLNYLMENC
jgi:hypothetical protein